MIKGINEYEKLKVVRPILGDHVLDKLKMPVMHKLTEDMIDFENAKPINIQNLSCKKNNSSKIAIAFAFDKILKRLWDNPLKNIPKLSSLMAVCTPDFSVYSSMNIYEISHNIYKNRWLGCLWQTYGCKVIPTIAWANSDTYDICFSGIEQGTVVAISTLGCLDKTKDFLEGFNEMKKRIKPSLIIVIGKMLEGMHGRFLNFHYEDCFSNNDEYVQLEPFHTSTIFEI